MIITMTTTIKAIIIKLLMPCYWKIKKEIKIFWESWRNKIILTFENGTIKKNIFAIVNDKIENSLMVNMVINKIWYKHNWKEYIQQQT